MKLIEACKNGCLASVNENLQDPGLEVDQRALVYAAGGGYLEMVNVLLTDSRIDPSWNQQEAYKMAMLCEEYNTALAIKRALGEEDYYKIILDTAKCNPMNSQQEINKLVAVCKEYQQVKK